MCVAFNLIFLLITFSSLPKPNQETICLRKVEGGIAAALKFSGKPTEDIVLEQEKELRSSLTRDGLSPKSGCLLARYNDPGRTWSFIMVSDSMYPTRRMQRDDIVSCCLLCHFQSSILSF